LCGFDLFCGKKAVPPAWVYTRFLRKLMRYGKEIQPMVDALIDRLEILLPDLGARLAVDSKALRTPATSRHKDAVLEPDGRCDCDADWGTKTYKGKQVKASNRGAKNPNDPFYWRFVNWDINPAGRDRSKEGKAARRKANAAGSPKSRPGVRFLEKGAAKLGAALEVFKNQLGLALAKINANPKANP